MSRIGLSLDHVLLATWGADRPPPSYAARLPGLNVLRGETLALIGRGTGELLERLATALVGCRRLDGAAAAATGSLRIEAQRAARQGLAALAVSEPFAAADPAARGLALADLAGLSDLGLTTVVEVADETLAALLADRVVVVRDGQPVVAYPVVAPAPRTLVDVHPVTDRLRARLSA
jgi:ABC-type phosphonate transport system ATPase subunit